MNPERLHLLIAEDEEAHIEAIRRSFDAAGADVEIRAVGTLREFRACAQERPPDLALVDLNLPDGRAVELLVQPPENGPFPILVMTAFGNQQIVVEVMKAGALDYVVKSPEAFATMPRTVEQTLREWKLLQKHRQVERALRQSETRYRTFVEASSDLIFLKDESFRYLISNQANCAILGKAEADVIGRTDFDFMPRDMAEHCHAGDQAALTQGKAVAAEETTGSRTYQTLKFPVSLPGGRTGVGGYIRDITERKQVDDKLRTSEERFRQVAETAIEWIWEMDADGVYTYSNSVVEQILGYTPKELVGKIHFYELMAPHIREEIRQAAAGRAARKEAFLKRVNPVVHKNGRIVILETTGVPILDPEGNLAGYRGADTDVTESKQVEIALKESEAQLSTAQEMAHAGHWEYDVVRDTFTFNDNFYRIFRTTAAEVGGYQMSSAEYARRFCHPDDMALVGREIQASNESTDPNYSRQIEHRILYADGTVGHISVRFSIVKDPQGRTIKTRGVNQDITEHKQAEEALRASQQITEGIINTIPMRVFWKDKNLVYLGCNRSFARDAGFLEPQDIVGKDDSQMGWSKQAELYRADDRQVIQSGKPKLFIEEPQTTPDGKTLTLLTSKIPLRDAGGEITGVLGTYMDITAHKQAEEQLRAVELRLRDVASNIPGAVYQLMAGRKGSFEVPYMSAGCERLFGRPLAGLDYAALWFDHMPPDDLAALRNSLAAAAKRMEIWTMEFRIVTPDGPVKWLRSSANPQQLPKGGVLWNGVLLDVTDLRLAEEQAHQEQALNKAIIESIPGTFYMLDETGKYVRWSAYQRDEIVGKPDDQVAQTNAADTIHPDDRALVQSRIANVLRNGTDETVEGRVLLRGGPASRWLLMTGRQLVVDGHPYLVGIGIDITQRKQAEEQMTKQLDELRRWQTVTLGREGRVAELKREVNALAARLGQPPPYKSAEEK